MLTFTYHSRINSTISILFTVFFLLSISSCTQKTESQSAPVTEQKRVIRLGFIPDQAASHLIDQYEPLRHYLSLETGYEFSFVTATSYEQMLTMFNNKQVDMVNFGAFTYLKAERSGNAIPLVMRDRDLEFTSHFLINASVSASNIAQTEGLSFAFGSESSTSGHLMPRYFLDTQNITPEVFYKRVIYSGSHDQTALLIQEAKVDLGVANSLTVNKMFNEGRLDPEKIKVLWISPPYVDYVWTMQSSISEEIRVSIMTAFLELSSSNAEDQMVLESLDAHYYVPASANDFNNLRKIASHLGYLGGKP